MAQETFAVDAVPVADTHRFWVAFQVQPLAVWQVEATYPEQTTLLVVVVALAQMPAVTFQLQLARAVHVAAVVLIPQLVVVVVVLIWDL